MISDKHANKHSRHRVRRRIVVLVICLVVVAGGGVAAWKFLPFFNKTSTQTTKTPNKGIEIKSAETLQKDIEATSDPKTKAALYSELSSAQQLAGDKAAATSSAQKAADLGATAADYAKLAATYEAAGDTARAIEMYKKAVSVSEVTNDPDINTDYNFYKGEVERLGGTN